MRYHLYAASLAMLCGLAAPAFAESMTFKADLSAKDEAPPTGTNGTGHVEATYDSASKTLSYTVDYTGLTGPATMAHFHGPASKGHNAEVQVPIKGPLASPIKGTATLTDAQAKDLEDGKMYFNIHTDAHKPGEIRGQVEKGS